MTEPTPRRQKLEKVYPDTGYDPYYRKVAQDSSLTFKARGMHVYMLSKPDGWKFSATEIARDQSVGRDLVETGLSELKEAGLYEVVRERDKYGRFETFGRVYAVPKTDPMLENPGTGESAGKPCATTDAGKTGKRKNRQAENPARRETSTRELPDDSLRSSSSRTTEAKIKATRLPADWQPDERTRTWTRDYVRGTTVNPRHELDQFRDYWVAKAGRDATKIDWLATWRRWVRTAVEHAGGRPDERQPSRADRNPAYRPAAEVLAEMELGAVTKEVPA